MQAAEHDDAPAFSVPSGRPVGRWRILIGLLQGGLLYLLGHAARSSGWPATEALLFSPLFLVALFVPVVLISGLGHLDRRRLLLWAGAVAVVLAGLGGWDGWRMADLPLPQANAGAGFPDVRHTVQTRMAFPSTGLVFLTAAALFVAHALVVSAVRDRRRIARYATYFDTAWTFGVQLAFSAMFTGAAWLVLVLGAQLFEMVRLHFLTILIGMQWFWIPVTTFAFACAMHLTDVRPAIVRGIRGLLLTMLSWLLPVTVLLIGGFLLTLPFSGLAPLWGTRHAASLLLVAAALFIVLINAAWQGGNAEATAVVRLAARAAAVLIAPLVLLAIHALTLRVRDHGWTPDRVHAAACMAVAACYAAGYLVAGLRPGWLPLVARVNIATAFAVPAIVVALGSPLADPARIAVASQVARLEAGRVEADEFDVMFLRFDAARFGRAALADLERAPPGPDGAGLRRRIAAVRVMKSRWDNDRPPVSHAGLAANLRVRPDGARLPDGFLGTDWTRSPDHWTIPACLREHGKRCDAALLDVDGDGRQEVLVTSVDELSGHVFAQDAGGRWTRFARLDASGIDCERLRDAMTAGRVNAVTPRLNDLDVGGVRLRLAPVTHERGCAPRRGPAPADED